MSNAKEEAEVLKKYKPYVTKVARSCVRQYRRFGLNDEEEFVQEGLIAVLVAYRAWRPDGGKGIFSWIHNPVYWAIRRAILKRLKGGRTRNVAIPLLVPYHEDAPEEEGERPVLTEGRKRLLQKVVDAGTPSEDKDELACKRLPEAMLTLNERQRTIIRMRFVSELTLEQIGQHLNLTRERVRQIEKEAIAQLRGFVQSKGGYGDE